MSAAPPRHGPHDGDDAAIDAAIDVYLRGALRHAPDAEATPPHALSDAILREAQHALRAGPIGEAAVGATATPSIAGAMSAIGARLGAWLSRPSVAGAFAGLFVATLVGMLWWDRPMDEAAAPARSIAPRQQDAAASRAATSALLRAASDAAPSPGVASPMPSPEADPSRPLPSAPDAAASRSPSRSAEPEKATGSAGRRMEAKPGAPVPLPPRPKIESWPSTANPPAPSDRETGPSELRAGADPQRPSPLASPSDAPMSTSPRAAETDVTSASAASPTTLSPPADVPPPNAASPRAARSTPASIAAAPPGASFLNDARPRPFAALRAEIADRPERWRWQRDGGTPQVVDIRMTAWLGDLDVATASADRNDRRDPGEHRVGAQVRLLRDGAVRATVRLDASGVSLTTPDANAPRRIALDPATATELRARLSDATR